MLFVEICIFEWFEDVSLERLIWDATFDVKNWKKSVKLKIFQQYTFLFKYKDSNYKKNCVFSAEWNFVKRTIAKSV